MFNRQPELLTAQSASTEQVLEVAYEIAIRENRRITAHENRLAVATNIGHTLLKATYYMAALSGLNLIRYIET